MVAVDAFLTTANILQVIGFPSNIFIFAFWNLWFWVYHGTSTVLAMLMVVHWFRILTCRATNQASGPVLCLHRLDQSQRSQASYEWSIRSGGSWLDSLKWSILRSRMLKVWTTVCLKWAILRNWMLKVGNIVRWYPSLHVPCSAGYAFSALDKCPRGERWPGERFLGDVRSCGKNHRGWAILCLTGIPGWWFQTFFRESEWLIGD